WSAHTVDVGEVRSDPTTGGKDVGRYTSITLDPDGKPGIAYLAVINDSGQIHSEVRFAQATVAQPASKNDWTISVVASAAAPAPTPADMMLANLQNVSGLFVASARHKDGSPVVAFYDHTKGQLVVAEFDKAGAAWKKPVVADGADGSADVGRYPSIAVSADD